MSEIRPFRYELSSPTAYKDDSHIRAEGLIDLDWKVEQKLARVLAERDLYWDGFLHGVWITVIIVAALTVAIWNQIEWNFHRQA